MRKLVGPVLVLSLAAAIGWPAAVLGGQFNKDKSIGDAAPQWQDLPGVDGEKHSLADLASKDVVVVVFTCNSCPYAVDVENRLIALHEQLAAAGNGALVAICSNANKEDTLEEITARAKERNFEFAYLHDDEKASLANAFGARRTPEFFVLDRERKIVYMGALDDSPEGKNIREKYVEKAIEAALAGKVPEVTETPPVGCLIRFPKMRRSR